MLTCSSHVGDELVGAMLFGGDEDLRINDSELDFPGTLPKRILLLNLVLASSKSNCKQDLISLDLNMSTRRGGATKGAPKHQNSFAFKHNKNSIKTKTI